MSFLTAWMERKEVHSPPIPKRLDGGWFRSPTPMPLGNTVVSVGCCLNIVKNGTAQRTFMSERRSRFPFWRRRGSPEDANRMTEMFNQPESEFRWDGKTLASMSRIGNSTKTGKSVNGFEPIGDMDLIREISLKNEVVNAILRRTVDDTLGNGYEFVLPDGKEEGDAGQLARVREFFRAPNPDDNGDEWLESLIYDLQLFGDAYLELDGSEDKQMSDDGTKWTYGGELVSIWNIPTETMKLLPANKRPAPPAMAYVQKIDGLKREFSSSKILHVSKFKHGRAYGTSPIVPLLNVIAGHLNLSNYLNELYTGTLPKTILNVGDISNGEMKAMLSLLEQQLAGGKSPFGLVAVNGGTGFNMHKLLDSTREGAQLDLIHYYREEICAVFGIPPMKLGWVQTGKMSNPEQQLDAWYDVIESFHNRIESLINNRILPLLDITDWVFKFVSIRPKRDNEIAETQSRQAQAISNLRQEGVISINEARNFLGLERLDLADADDPMFLSPKLSINKGKVNGGGEETADSNDSSPLTPPSLAELFPPPEAPDNEGAKLGGIPPCTVPVDIELNSNTTGLMANRRMKQNDEYEALITTNSLELLAQFTDLQSQFAVDVLDALDKMFADGDEAVQMPNVDLKSVRAYRRKADIDLNQIESAIVEIDTRIADTIGRQNLMATAVLTDSFGESLELTLGGTAIDVALNADDLSAIAYWNGRWTLPALRNTLGAHRNALLGVFEAMVGQGQSWRWAKTEMRSLIDPTGSRYPAYWYERIARTETRRVVENAHLSGLRKAGFQKVERIVVVDERTDRDLCAPFENAIYPIAESRSVVPAHPNCRCTFVAYAGDKEPIDSDTILVPDVEGSE